MKTAVVLIRERPHYRLDAFSAGLARCGYRVERNQSAPLADLLVIWNRSGIGAVTAARYERKGLPVIVAENGYIGIDAIGHHLFALSLGHHNGAGRFPYCFTHSHVPADRFEALGVSLAPWRDAPGGDVLILPQRGIGPAGVAMPPRWLSAVLPRVRASTWRSIRVREHPASKRPAVPVEAEFPTAAAAVTWGSGAAIKALAAGVPVFHEMPLWIGAHAARRDLDFENPCTDDDARYRMFCRLAYAQWTAEEIASGAAIDRVMECR